MEIIKQSHEILSLPENLLEMLEKAGRTCYKSEDRITKKSAPKFISMLRDRGHHAMIEFGDIIIKFTTNRGVTHEIVRHRMCSFAQESTRYVNYKGRMKFIRPAWLSSEIDGAYTTSGDIDPILLPSDPEHRFIVNLLSCELDYVWLLNQGWRPEQAREVLPNALKTEIVWKANIREWRHILTLRCSKAAHPQMRNLMLPVLEELKHKLPIVFDNINN